MWIIPLGRNVSINLHVTIVLFDIMLVVISIGIFLHLFARARTHTHTHTLRWVKKMTAQWSEPQTDLQPQSPSVAVPPAAPHGGTLHRRWLFPSRRPVMPEDRIESFLRGILKTFILDIILDGGGNSAEILGSFLSKVITSVAFVRNGLPEVWG